MIKNRLRQLWNEGTPTINSWCSIGNSLTAEIMAAQGYDSLVVDVQHGAIDYAAALSMFQAMKGTGVTPLARTPWLDPAMIMKLLDAGAMGIICPMISTAEQAAEFASYMRYPPNGQRSFGPTRAGFAMKGYGIDINNEILAFAMIETAQGMENLDAIAATPGIDGLYVGPGDLTLGLSKGQVAPAFDREDKDFIAALRRITEACQANGKFSALHCMSTQYAMRGIEWGYNMTTIGGDTRFLAAAAGASVADFRDKTGTSGATPEKPLY